MVMWGILLGPRQYASKHVRNFLVWHATAVVNHSDAVVSFGFDTLTSSWDFLGALSLHCDFFHIWLDGLQLR